jgi:uncharacterized protein (TIGR00369 family)
LQAAQLEQAMLLRVARRNHVTGRRCASSALDPATIAVVTDSFNKQGLMTSMGASIELIARGKCAIEVPFSDSLAQQHGYFHAGVTSSIADSAAGYAALSCMPSGSDVLATGFSVSLIGVAKGQLLRAEATVVKSGRTLTVSRVDITVRDGDEVKPVAVMQQTSFRIDPRN